MEGKGRGKRKKDRVMRMTGNRRRESSLRIFSSWGCHYIIAQPWIRVAFHCQFSMKEMTQKSRDA